MKQCLFIILLLTAIFLQVAAQDNKPEEKTIVNKEFDESILDSAFSTPFNNHLFNFKPFQNDDFFAHFQQQFVDSAFSQQFEFFSDSASVFPFDAEKLFSNELFSKDFDAIHEKLLQQLNGMNSGKPVFESKAEEKAWQELMEKQKSEREEMLKRLKEQ